MYPGYNVIINTILAFVRLRNSICRQRKSAMVRSLSFGRCCIGKTAFLGMGDIQSDFAYCKPLFFCCDFTNNHAEMAAMRGEGITLHCQRGIGVKKAMFGKTERRGGGSSRLTGRSPANADSPGLPPPHSSIL